MPANLALHPDPAPAGKPPPPLRIGTAGWVYEDWNTIVYPARPVRGFDRLALMASLFDTNEINSTFYRIPPPRQTADWSRRVSHNPRFAFTAKLYRGFTHERNAGHAEEKAFQLAIERLQGDGRLGCVLAQFPMSFRNHAENREYLEGTLRRFSCFPLAVEFRHESWDTPEARKLLSERDAAFVNIDQPTLEGNLPPTAHLTASIAYYRLHGRNAEKWFGPETSNQERYNYLYSKTELEPWVERIREGQKALARTRRSSHDPARGVYVIFNNHFRGQAVVNALELQHLFTGEKRHIPDTLRQSYRTLEAIAVPAARSPQMPLFDNARGHN